jgi:hypothetical protein
VAKLAEPCESWFASHIEWLDVPSGEMGSAWLFLAQLAWLSQAELSFGNTIVSLSP